MAGLNAFSLPPVVDRVLLVFPEAQVVERAICSTKVKGYRLGQTD